MNKATCLKWVDKGKAVQRIDVVDTVAIIGVAEVTEGWQSWRRGETCVSTKKELLHFLQRRPVDNTGRKDVRKGFHTGS